MSRTYHFANIYTLLIEGFVDAELRAFCFDSPDLRPVYYQKSEMETKELTVGQEAKRSRKSVM